MFVKRTVDWTGGVGSIVVAIGCAWIGYQDWQRGHSVWKIFAFMCVVLVLNGVAMFRYSMRAGAGRANDLAVPPGGIVTRSSRV